MPVSILSVKFHESSENGNIVHVIFYRFLLTTVEKQNIIGKNMKITPKQLLVLWECFTQHINTIPSGGGIQPKDKRRIYDQIINQQDDTTLIEIKNEQTIQEKPKSDLA